MTHIYFCRKCKTEQPQVDKIRCGLYWNAKLACGHTGIKRYHYLRTIGTSALETCAVCGDGLDENTSCLVPGSNGCVIDVCLPCYESIKRYFLSLQMEKILP